MKRVFNKHNRHGLQGAKYWEMLKLNVYYTLHMEYLTT